jgi:hypothetical protein
VKFTTRPESLGCTYEAITMTGNVFDGNVIFHDSRSPALTTIQDVIFADNICEGDVISASRATMLSRHVVVRGNMLRQKGTVTLNASQWIWTGNTHVNGTLEVAAGSKANIIRDNVTAAPITDHSTEAVMTGNVVMKKTDAP